MYYPSSATNSNVSMYSNSFLPNNQQQQAMRVRSGPSGVMGMPPGVNLMNGGGLVAAMGGGNGAAPIYPSKVDVYMPQKKSSEVRIVNTSERIRKGNAANYDHFYRNDKYHRCASDDHF
jgi:hypothetical protein